MRQLLETFDVRNIDRIIGANSNVQQSGINSNQAVGQIPGLGNIPQLLTA
jgi:hypothetical protein